MFSVVPGVPAAPPTLGLVAAAERPDPATMPRWEQGMAWIPERVGSAYQLVPRCADPAGGYTPPRPGAAYYQPPGLRIADQCTTLSGPVDEERARRVADAQRPWAIARELWSGTATQADTYVSGAPVAGPNAYLAQNSTTTTVGGTPAVNADAGLGRLEQAALELSHGMPVMIHVPVLMLPRLINTFRVVGTALYTYAGSRLVADGGYPGTGPAGQAVGATAWMYATSPVQVLMSPWQLTVEEPQVVDKDHNTRTVWADCVFAATFDPGLHLATEVTL